MSGKQNRAAIIALLAAVGCILITIGAVIYHAKSKQLRGLKRDLSQVQQKVEEVHTKVKRLPVLETEYEELSHQVAVLEPSLPTEAYIPTFLSQLQTLAGETDNRLTLIKPKPRRNLPVAQAPEQDVVADDATTAKPAALQPEPEQPVSPYDEIGIEVAFEGSYWTALEFLQELKRFPKMIAVNNLSMKPACSRSAVQGSNPLLEVTFQLIAVIPKEK